MSKRFTLGLSLFFSSLPAVAFAQAQPPASSAAPATQPMPGAQPYGTPAHAAPGYTPASTPPAGQPYAGAPQPYAASPQPYAATEPGAAAPMAGPAAQPAPMDEAASGPPFVRDPKATVQGMGSVFGMLGYGYGFDAGYGVGARFQLVLASKLINHKKIHDELGIEFGIDYLQSTYDYGFAGYKVEWTYREITPVVGIDWMFWLSNRVALYPKVDLGYHITSWSVDSSTGSSESHADVSSFYFQGAGGVVFRATPGLAVRAEAGWRALRVGVGFNFI